MEVKESVVRLEILVLLVILDHQAHQEPPVVLEHRVRSGLLVSRVRPVRQVPQAALEPLDLRDRPGLRGLQE